jgi:hypothetical protein
MNVAYASVHSADFGQPPARHNSIAQSTLNAAFASRGALKIAAAATAAVSVVDLRKGSI